jgi:heme exporter protein B
MRLRGVLGILMKDFRSELRTRYAFNALLMFVITTLSIIMFSIGGVELTADVYAGILWVIIFFSAMSGLSRAFVSEEERGTVMTLRLIATSSTVYYGKLLFNLVLMFAVNAVTVFLYLLLIGSFRVESPVIFAGTMVLATAGLASSSTILAALIAKANVRGTLYPVISFPIILPLLLTAIHATQLAAGGATLAEALQDFQVLIAYVVVLNVVPVLVFDFIWRD